MGYINVRRMLSEITWQQLIEWMAFADLEPFDEERQDVRLAQLRATILNVNRDSKKKPTPFTWQDLLMTFGDSVQPERPKQSWQAQKMIGQQMAMMFNAMQQPGKPRRDRG